MDLALGFGYSRGVPARYVPILVMLAACGKSVFPPPVIPPRPSVEEWPDAGAVILEDVAALELKVHQFDDDPKPRFVAVLEHRRRIKILSEPGLAAASFELDVDGYSTVSDVIGRAVAPDGTVTALQDVQTAPWPEGKKRPELQRMRFTVPGATVGGLVDWRYVRTFSDPSLLPVWVFGDKYPIVRAEMAVFAGDAVRLDFRTGRGTQREDIQPLRRELPGGKGERLVFVVTDVPPYYDEPYMPHRARMAPWLAVSPTLWEIQKQTYRLESWHDIQARMLDFQAQVKPPKGDGLPASRYRKLRDGMQPVDALGLGVLPPAGSVQILSGMQVAPRDAAVMLLGAFDGSSLKYFPALATAPTGPTAVEDFATLGGFVRLLVAVKAEGDVLDRSTCTKPDAEPICRAVAGEYVLLDPACKTCRYGELPQSLAGGRVVVLDDGPTWLDLPADPAEQHRLRLQYQLKFDSRGKVTGTVDGQARGHLAGALRRALEADTAGRDAAVSAVAFGEGAVAKLQNVDDKDNVSVDQPLSFTAKLESELTKEGYESFRVRPARLLGPGLPGDYRATRRYDALLEGPSFREHIATIDLPVGYEVEAVPQVRISTPLLEYSAGFERRDKLLTYARRLRLLRRVIKADEWAAFRQVLDQIATVEEQGIRVWVPE